VKACSAYSAGGSVRDLRGRGIILWLIWVLRVDEDVSKRRRQVMQGDDEDGRRLLINTAVA
jgi:hypothetical protein